MHFSRAVLPTLIPAAAVLLSLIASPTVVAQNLPPPSGAILDLAGTPIPDTAPQLYTVDFTANLASTAITFAFRNDPSFIEFSSPSLVDLTTSSANLFTNADFSGGTYVGGSSSQNLPNGWTYANAAGATYPGTILPASNCSNGTTACWFDGAVQSYDALSQTIATNVGDVYQVSFYIYTNGGTSFQAISTNGLPDVQGNAIDVLAYAQGGIPFLGAVPEPSTYALMGVGLLLLAAAVRRARAA